MGSPRLTARPGTPCLVLIAGSGIRTPVAWLEARSLAAGPIPQGQDSRLSGRRGSWTLKAHRSSDFESGAHLQSFNRTQSNRHAGERPPKNATFLAEPDPDFEAIREAWPWLSAEDRKRLASLAKEAALQNG
jgi:hypothetical protein